MKKIFLFSAIFIMQMTSSFALFEVFDEFINLFSSDKENRIELFDHIESLIISQQPETFYYFETDFYNTGKPYIWISNDKSNEGNGYFFSVYKKVDDHYELLEDYAIFAPEMLAFYGKDFSNVNARLLTYSRVSGQEGNLVVYKIDDKDKINAFVYKTIEPMGQDAELFEKLFPEENKFVKQIPKDKMIDFLASRGIRSKKKSQIEFLAFDLGGKTGVVVLATNPAETKGASGWAAFNMYRKDTLLNDIGLNFVDINLSLDNLIPFEVRNPGWKKLQVFPEGRKIIFFKKYSFIRQIDGRKFLVTISREGKSETTVSFYQLTSNRICAFDIADLRVGEKDEASDEGETKQALEFIKALDFDYDKDGKLFNYKLYPAKDVVYENREITIPKDLDVDDDIYELKEIKLPENNKFTDEFRNKQRQVNKAAREKLKEDAKKAELAKKAIAEKKDGQKTK